MSGPSRTERVTMSDDYEDGEIEIVDDANGLIARIHGDGKFAEASVAEILHRLTDEQRMALFSEFCGGCGTTSLPCHCRNDE